jgi:predicted DNA binding CopG/RHH family protein
VADNRQIQSIPRVPGQLDISAQKHKDAKMRTTIEIPDELYRSLKARAALSGVPVREVVAQLIDQGMKSVPSGATPRDRRREPPPVAIAPRGFPIQALSHKGKARADEREDEAKLARSA